MEQQIEEVVQGSIVLDPSSDSNSFVGNADMEVEQQPNLAIVQAQNHIVHIGMARTVFGPALPPSMFWDRYFLSPIPTLISEAIPRPICGHAISSVLLSKRSWSVAFEGQFKV